jgi:prephenate dehydrogenase
MKIGVVGAGSVGTAIAKRLVPQGHEVMLSYSRDVAQLEGAAKAFGAITGSPADAVRLPFPVRPASNCTHELQDFSTASPPYPASLLCCMYQAR